MKGGLARVASIPMPAKPARRGMKVLVCGSRDWPIPTAIKHKLRGLPRGSEIIHGGARGADQMAAAYARALGIPETAFPADWRGKGKRAGIIRNLEILDQKPDLVLAFQHNESRGTQHTIDEARRRGIPVEVFADPVQTPSRGGGE